MLKVNGKIWTASINEDETKGEISVYCTVVSEKKKYIII